MEIGLVFIENQNYIKFCFYKQKAVINIYTSIVFNTDMNEIIIFTDGGRCCRPLHIVENRILKYSQCKSILENGTYKWRNLVFGEVSI